MSFDDYVNHITQKYRLAISVAILKSKPEDLTTEQYISVLKNEMNRNSMDTDDSNISITSKDFILDDDDHENIINGISIDNQPISINDVLIEIDNSMTILKDFDVNMKSVENLEMLNDSVADTLKLLRDIDENTAVDKSNTESDNLTQMIYYEGTTQASYNPIATKTSNTENVDKNKKAYDDTLELNNLEDVNMTEDDGTNWMDSRIAANISKNIRKGVNMDGEMNQISQNTSECMNRENSSKYRDVTSTQVHNNTKNSIENKQVTNTLIDSDEMNPSKYKMKHNEYLARKMCKNLNNESNVQIIKAIDQSEVNMTTNLEELNQSEYSKEYNDLIASEVCKNLNKLIHLNETVQNDSQETQLYSLHGYTQNYTHVSQSQTENIQIGERFIHGNKKRNIENVTAINFEETYVPNYCNNIDINIANVNEGNTIQTFRHIENETQNVNDGRSQVMDIIPTEILYFINNEGKYKVCNQNGTVNDKSKIDIDEKLNNQAHASTVSTSERNIHTNTTNNQVYQSTVETQDTDNTQVYQSTVSTQDTEDFEEELTVSQKELVPFKVIEELNKVKVFLNRRERTISTDGNRSDSGYKSDSQSKSSYKSALQLSGNWFNQSAHCLFSHLLQCLLVATTKDITNEISQMLGRLIDRLHDEEKYPTFLDDILENVDLLLQDVYKGESSYDNVMKKDENIQRIFLLNKSLHIITYTIEKINNILDDVYSFLTTEETYELINIEETENICHIFHILEVLIKRYVKDKHMSSPDSFQLSQNEDKLLKKSSIMDIWRKKWNPDQKAAKCEVAEKRCVLTKCGEILNKIIVECMDGYSLVAFAALQCFNLLQS